MLDYRKVLTISDMRKIDAYDKLKIHEELIKVQRKIKSKYGSLGYDYLYDYAMDIQKKYKSLNEVEKKLLEISIMSNDNENFIKTLLKHGISYKHLYMLLCYIYAVKAQDLSEIENNKDLKEELEKISMLGTIINPLMTREQTINKCTQVVVFDKQLYKSLEKKHIKTR